MPTMEEWTEAAIICKQKKDKELESLRDRILAKEAEIYRREQDERLRHDKEMKLIHLDRMKLQKECPHEVQRYWPDPSGNSGSFYECLWCGKEF